jgi:DNA-binding NarL/FixJ family response regulator
MRGLDGVTATRRIVETCDAAVLLVADSATDGRVMPAVLAGASGLVTEGVGPREPVRVVCAVADGGTVLPTGIGDRLAAAYRESGA